MPASVLVTSLTSEPIRFINLNNGTWPWMTTLRVRGPSPQTPCGRVDSITAFDSGPAEVAELRMLGNLGANLSSGDDAIQGFQNVGTVRITGDVLDTVNATTKITDCEVTGAVYGDFVALGDEQIGGPAIVYLAVKGTQQAPHSLYGNVEAPNGRIGTIEVQYGDIGAAQSPATIAAGVGTDDRIQYINVPNGNIYADIASRDIEFADGGNEDAFYLHGNLLGTTIALTDAIRDNFTIEGGDFGADSSILAVAIGDQAKFKVLRDENTETGGYLKGDITFTGHISPQSPFRIDESLEGTLSIGLRLWDTVTINGISSNGDGLVGRIIVNGTNTTGEWLSPVIVGGTTLAPTPYYDNPSSTIGGGAIGLVPYTNPCSIHLTSHKHMV